MQSHHEVYEVRVRLGVPLEGGAWAPAGAAEPDKPHRDGSSGIGASWRASRAVWSMGAGGWHARRVTAVAVLANLSFAAALAVVFHGWGRGGGLAVPPHATAAAASGEPPAWLAHWIAPATRGVDLRLVPQVPPGPSMPPARVAHETAPADKDLVPTVVLAVAKSASESPRIRTAERVPAPRLEPRRARPGPTPDTSATAPDVPIHRAPVRDGAAPRKPRSGDLLVAFGDNETVIVPDRFGMPTPFRIGQQLPSGARLLAVDRQAGSAQTDRGVLRLE